MAVSLGELDEMGKCGPYLGGWPRRHRPKPRQAGNGATVWDGAGGAGFKILLRGVIFAFSLPCAPHVGVIYAYGARAAEKRKNP